MTAYPRQIVDELLGFGDHQNVMGQSGAISRTGLPIGDNVLHVVSPPFPGSFAQRPLPALQAHVFESLREQKNPDTKKVQGYFFHQLYPSPNARLLAFGSASTRPSHPVQTGQWICGLCYRLQRRDRHGFTPCSDSVQTIDLWYSAKSPPGVKRKVFPLGRGTSRGGVFLA